MPLYEAECEEGHRFEKLLKMDSRHTRLECPECGGKAFVVVSAVRSKLDGTDPSFPGEYLKWERKRAGKL